MGHLGVIRGQTGSFSDKYSSTSFDSKPFDDIPVSVPGSGSG